jgi:hypothetical protein
MIVSHKHKFIFIKTNKTAGTSIEIALSRYCGRKDIVTPVTRRDEKARRKLGYTGCRNYLAPPWEYSRNDLSMLLTAHKLKKKYYNHMPAREIRERIGEDIWNSYFKFCFERNPWDRMVSLYFWLNRKNDDAPSMKEFLDSDKPDLLKRRGIDAYRIDGKIAVDKICRFEHLQEDLDAVCKQVGIPGRLELPHAKSGHRKDKKNYRTIITESDRDRIAEMFKDEIELMGYEF